MKNLMRNTRLLIISLSIITSSGCTTTKTVVHREIVVADSPRHQAVVDSLRFQIKECEGALNAWTKFEDFKIK